MVSGHALFSSQSFIIAIYIIVVDQNVLCKQKNVWNPAVVSRLVKGSYLLASQYLGKVNGMRWYRHVLRRYMMGMF